jgi:hypothetical protein
MTNIFQWVIGILIILLGLFAQTYSFFGGITIFLSGAWLIPPYSKWVLKKGKLDFSQQQIMLVAISFFLLGIIISLLIH